MLLSNIASLVKNQVDEELQISSKRSNKHRYQANRAFIIGRIKKILPKILCGMYNFSCIDVLYIDAHRNKSQITPDRKYKRKKNKAIGRTHFKNQKVSF